MVEKRGPWSVTSSELVWKNEFLTVRDDQVYGLDGLPARYATVELKPGVAILPVHEDGRVELVEQSRYALGARSLETVAGGREADEEPLEAARRELEEELGLTAERWTHLGILHLDTSIVKAPVALFLARRLQRGQPHRDASEDISTSRMPLAEAVQAVLRGTIVHAASCALILKADVLLRSEGPR